VITENLPVGSIVMLYTYKRNSQCNMGQRIPPSRLLYIQPGYTLACCTGTNSWMNLKFSPQRWPRKAQRAYIAMRSKFDTPPLKTLSHVAQWCGNSGRWTGYQI